MVLESGECFEEHGVECLVRTVAFWTVHPRCCGTLTDVRVKRTVHQLSFFTSCAYELLKLWFKRRSGVRYSDSFHCNERFVREEVLCFSREVSGYDAPVYVSPSNDFTRSHAELSEDGGCVLMFADGQFDFCGPSFAFEDFVNVR